MSSDLRVKLRVTLAVSAGWLLIGVVLGSQNALGMSLQNTPIPLAGAVRTQLINSLPWIPVTLAAIWLATRWPITRTTWRRNLRIHAVAFPVLAWIANVGVVLGFWWANGTWGGVVELASSAAFWATIRVHVALTVYAMTVGLTQTWAYVREARRRELGVAQLEAQLARARFRALNEQIRPHFLFNTLHTIGQLWRSGRTEAADAMLDRLGALFQKVRGSADHPMIPLDDELSMVEDYLEIERARFSDRLAIDVRAGPEARGCLVPPLLLQPLVENAIRHGVSASPDAGCVAVDARVDDDRLVIEVRDDGPGMANPSPSPGTGTGLSNTRERLRHAYAGPRSLRVMGGDGGGTCVRLELPVAHDEDLLPAPRREGVLPTAPDEREFPTTHEGVDSSSDGIGSPDA